jgi:hypothetical protein
MDEANLSRFVHFAEVIPLVTLFDVDAMPTFMWDAGLGPFSGSGRLD